MSSPNHFWGDEWFEKNGPDLYAAEFYIYKFVKRWSGCTVITKEKYGTLRYEYVFCPGVSVYVNRFDKFLISLFGQRFIKTDRGGYHIPRVQWHGCYIQRKWTQYGKFILSIAIKKACKKFPNVREELLDDYDPDFICG